MITIVLISSLFGFSLMQRNSRDKRACLCFSIPAISVYIIGDYIPGFIYFHVCAVIDLLSILIILKIKSCLSVILSKSLFISIVLNLLGFIMWYCYISPIYYISLFAIYYFFMCLLLVLRGDILWISFHRLSDSFGF
jgi:hypothetical protein